eukprot:c21805_g1_i1 orf=514-852(+)
MAGDVNLYMNDLEDLQTAEIEIMIADLDCRRQGLGKEAVMMMIAFATQHLGILKFRAKIGDSNRASLHLFRSMGFKDVCHSSVFKQVTLDLVADEVLCTSLRDSVGDLIMHA